MMRPARFRPFGSLRQYNDELNALALSRHSGGLSDSQYRQARSRILRLLSAPETIDGLSDEAPTESLTAARGQMPLPLPQHHAARVKPRRSTPLRLVMTLGVFVAFVLLSCVFILSMVVAGGLV